MFEAITEDIFNLKNTHNIPICLIGDLNSRTGNLDDTFTIEQSVINNCEIDGFAQELFDLSHNNDAEIMSGKRHNKDTFVNNNGNLLINFCKVSNMRIVNDRFGSDKGIDRFCMIFLLSFVRTFFLDQIDLIFSPDGGTLAAKKKLSISV